jgi:hypothetical protein
MMDPAAPAAHRELWRPHPSRAGLSSEKLNSTTSSTAETRRMAITILHATNTADESA